MAKKKKCTKCKKKKTLDRFHRSANAIDGFVSRCKDCKQEYGKKYREDNSEKAREIGRKWRLANPEYARKYCEANLKEKKEYDKNYRIDNREKNRIYCKKYREDNPGYDKKYRETYPEKILAKYRRRRAMKRGVAECFTDEEADFVRSFWGNCCAVCNKPQAKERKALPIDHWHPLNNGNPLTMPNAVLLCQNHNSRKGAKEPSEAFSAKTVSRIERKILLQVKG